MIRFRTLVTGLFLLAAAAPARADITGFLGSNTTPSARSAKGVALGMSVLIVGFEIEASITDSDAAANAPSLKTGMANVFLQSPLPIFGFRPYFTIGGGIYREELGPATDTALGVNTGVGVKYKIIGPLGVRFDYRVFKLGSNALQTPAHRIYVGVTLF
jgi:hypothetical protein